MADEISAHTSRNSLTSRLSGAGATSPHAMDMKAASNVAVGRRKVPIIRRGKTLLSFYLSIDEDKHGMACSEVLLRFPTIYVTDGMKFAKKYIALCPCIADRS